MLRKVRVEDSCNTVGNAVREQSAAQRDFSMRKNEAGEVFVQLKHGQIIWDITMEERMQLYFGKRS